MKKLTHCPFCNDTLTERSDYYYSEHCSGKEDHTYIQVFDFNGDGEVTRIKLRVGAGDIRYYLDKYINESFSYVWSGRNNNQNKILIDKKIPLDLSRGIDGIKEQIKLYLTFH